MAQNLDVGKQLADFVAQFGEGGVVDLPDCAVGAICAQTDLETALFCENIKNNYPEQLNSVKAELLVVDDTRGKWYGYKVGIDADKVVHYYKGQPIQKLLNIWNYGTADGKIPRTMFWGKALRKLRNKNVRATDRFYNLIDKRYNGYVAHAPSTGKELYDKEKHYAENKQDYLSADELQKLNILKTKIILESNKTER